MQPHKNFLSFATLLICLRAKQMHFPAEKKQRIALCLQLIKQPALLVLDEPFSNLDMAHTNILKKILKDVAAELKITLLLSSHQPQDILSWADEIIILQSGEIIQQGTPECIYYNPVNEYAAGLFGAYNIFTQQQARQFGLTVKEAVFIRPEKVCIVNYGNGFEAIVKEIAFMGSFYELVVYVQEINIIFKSLEE